MAIKLNAILTLILSTLLLTNCTSIHNGSTPAFSLQGHEAKRERNEFYMKKQLWSFPPNAIQMGDPKTAFSTTSLEPVFLSVSTKAYNQVQTHHYWKRASQVLAFVFLYSLFDSFGNQKNSSPAPTALFYSSGALFLGTSIYSEVLLTQAVDNYNKELKARFAPSISVQYEF